MAGSSGDALAGEHLVYVSAAEEAVGMDIARTASAARMRAVARGASFLEYAQRRLGLEGHAVAERLRVAHALRELPATRRALANGDRPWASVRELTRVAVPDSEDEWLQASAAMTSRDLQQLVAGQVALVQCEDCGRTWQQAAGDTVEVPAELVERADCDGQHIGRVDQSPAGPSPAGRSSRAGRATQTIPPATRRLVVRRDHGRCRVPGCRNSAWIEVHHLQLRSEQGGHDPSNLACLCGAHHQRLHAGFLLVDGDAEGELTFRHADGAVYGSGVDTQVVSVQGAAYGALRQLRFRETESKQALARVRSRGASLHPTGCAGLDASLEQVIGWRWQS